MANDCLVTKLKRVVDNDNLQKLGELEFGVTSGSKVAFSVYPNTEQFTLSLSEGATFSDTTTEKTFTYYCDELPITGNGKLKVNNKYHLDSAKLLDGVTGDVSVLNYGNYAFLRINNNPNLEGDVSKLQYNATIAANELYLENCPKISGNIENLLNSLVGPSACRVSIYDTGCSGNIGNISNSHIQSLVIRDNNGITGLIEGIDIPNVTGICYVDGVNIAGSIDNIQYSKMSKVGTLVLQNTQCTGSIEGIANNFKSYKAANSTLIIKVNGLITYQGTAIEKGIEPTITFDGAGGYTVTIQ